ncbi:hypothetical protein OAT97_00765 [Gammaproteobacteria bacterium]|nr:hypothetical protein [Gammaproteobacteria bacterium]
MKFNILNTINDIKLHLEDDNITSSYLIAPKTYKDSLDTQNIYQSGNQRFIDFHLAAFFNIVLDNYQIINDKLAKLESDLVVLDYAIMNPHKLNHTIYSGTPVYAESDECELYVAIADILIDTLIEFNLVTKKEFHHEL